MFFQWKICLLSLIINYIVINYYRMQITDYTPDLFSLLLNNQDNCQQIWATSKFQREHYSKGHGRGQEIYDQCDDTDPTPNDIDCLHICLQLFHSSRKLCWSGCYDSIAGLFTDCHCCPELWRLITCGNTDCEPGVCAWVDPGYYSDVFHMNQTKGKLH